MLGGEAFQSKMTFIFDGNEMATAAIKLKYDFNDDKMLSMKKCVPLN